MLHLPPRSLTAPPEKRCYRLPSTFFLLVKLVVKLQGVFSYKILPWGPHNNSIYNDRLEAHLIWIPDLFLPAGLGDSAWSPDPIGQCSRTDHRMGLLVCWKTVLAFGTVFKQNASDTVGLGFESQKRFRDDACWLKRCLQGQEKAAVHHVWNNFVNRSPKPSFTPTCDECFQTWQRCGSQSIDGCQECGPVPVSTAFV